MKLASPIYKNRACNRDLKPAAVKNIIKHAAKKSGESPDTILDYSGHSLRVGAAQHLLMQGFDTAAIMRAGGWKSISTLARYLEKAEHNVWNS
jgi:site-specific recombinase XerD